MVRYQEMTFEEVKDEITLELITLLGSFQLVIIFLMFGIILYHQEPLIYTISFFSSIFIFIIMVVWLFNAY